MKKIIALIAAAALCFSAAACGEAAPSPSPSESSAAESTSLTRIELDGYCVKGTDGFILFCGEDDWQQAYILVNDDSGKDIIASLKDGDHIKITADVNTEYIPYNATIIDGEILDSGTVVKINESVYNALTGVFMLDSDLEEKGIVTVTP